MKKYDVIIIGGSIAGLSAAMTLGRSLRKVLVIDKSTPCNRFTPYSHNFLTQDGSTPKEILDTARNQISKYKTVEFYDGEVTDVVKLDNAFKVIINAENESFESMKVIFATGLKDNLPDIKGLKECWGISAIHCPYCHGYEFKQMKTGILANGEAAFHYAKLVSNLTSDLKIFTNGISGFTDEQLDYLNENNIQIIENEIIEVENKNGFMEGIYLNDNQFIKLKALYIKPNSEQSCKIPEDLGCKINSIGLIEVEISQKTNIEGIYACGDNSNMFRSIAAATSAGNMAGASVNLHLQN